MDIPVNLSRTFQAEKAKKHIANPPLPPFSQDLPRLKNYLKPQATPKGNAYFVAPFPRRRWTFEKGLVVIQTGMSSW